MVTSKAERISNPLRAFSAIFFYLLRMPMPWVSSCLFLFIIDEYYPFAILLICFITSYLLLFINLQFFYSYKLLYSRMSFLFVNMLFYYLRYCNCYYKSTILLCNFSIMPSSYCIGKCGSEDYELAAISSSGSWRTI